MRFYSRRLVIEAGPHIQPSWAVYPGLPTVIRLGRVYIRLGSW
jgi:hypothetical protein